MDEKIANEKIDRFLRRLVHDAGADNATVDEAALSPTVWWGIQRQILERQEEVRSPWPPVAKVWRWLMVGLPAAAAAVLLITFYTSMPTEPSVVSDGGPNKGYETQAIVPDIPREVASVTEKIAVTPAKLARESKPVVRELKHRPPATKMKPESRSNVGREEIRSDFIALSYARDPESGQIVRVKVPSSMLVTMGLVASVEKPTDLVDAEILVGDDGLSRAIRFIR